jgi:hypothetical protein
MSKKNSFAVPLMLKMTVCVREEWDRDKISATG